MDCDRFESAMMDELYGELDEVTSAAVKRHLAACGRCATLFGGLRATRRVAVMPIVEPPPDLERRILENMNGALRMVPFRRRVAQAVSVAGSWAMRPQTAMAAVFLVMLGASVLLLRGRSSRAPASAEMTVTQEGTPAPAAPSAGPASAATDIAPSAMGPLATNESAKSKPPAVPSRTAPPGSRWPLALVPVHLPRRRPPRQRARQRRRRLQESWQARPRRSRIRPHPLPDLRQAHVACRPLRRSWNPVTGWAQTWRLRAPCAMREAVGPR
jgi:hypothetical protein